MSMARLIASCFGLGRLRPAPGTIGSAFALVVFVLFLAGQSPMVQAVAIVVATFVGIAAASAVERELGLEDPSEVVIDELAGMWVSVFAIDSVPAWIVAFFVFRLFDIVKPFPARQLEALHGGWGIVLDDLVAGAYTWIVVQALLRWGIL
jgi:phosphatidylglycerophosphatase A